MGLFDFFKKNNSPKIPKNNNVNSQVEDLSSEAKKQIESTSGNNVDIYELDRQSQAESDKYYQNHKSLFENLDFSNVKVKPSEPELLTSTEGYFLKAISNQIVEKLNLPGYWTYEYNINYKQLITKLLENGYVKISSAIDDLSFLTAEQLKEILRYFLLPVSGKKQELIDRLLSNHVEIDVALKSLDLYAYRFILTPAGKKIVKALPKSMTKNIEFEDRCVDLILQQDFSGAWREVCNFERKKVFPRGMSIDWEKEYSLELNDNSNMLFSYFWNTDISNYLPKQCIDYIPQIKACIIFGDMMGVAVDKVVMLITRIIPTITKDSKLVGAIQDLQFKLMDVKQIKSLSELLS